MTRDLSRLLAPRSIAVIGGGWGESVVLQLRKAGFCGAIWPVHPTKDEVGGLPAFANLATLPAAPDAGFIAVNRTATVEVSGELARMGAGGAICFASGFAEAVAEADDGADLQAALIAAAGDMPILGPNCYGMINALEAAPLWPDQHGCRPCSSGVAILAQSSNIALNLTMQARGLPLAMLATLGNQAQTGMADFAGALLDDPRITALGFYIEGFKDLRAWERLAEKAVKRGIPMVALKAGRSAQAQAASLSHTASLAGSQAGASALLKRLGIGEVQSLPAMLEALKLMHLGGWLASNRVASMSCSGGEAGLMADSGGALEFPPLTPAQEAGLRPALGPMVALANPLDYHTYIWGDSARMEAAFTAMMQAELALGILILDFPRPDLCDPSDWDHAVAAIKGAAKATGRRMAILSCLPETMPEQVAERLIKAGITPLMGLTDAVEGITAAIAPAPVAQTPLALPPENPAPAALLTEAKAKAALGFYGLDLPRATRATTPAEAGRMASTLTYPLALKGEGLAHKSEAGAVALNLTSAKAVEARAKAMPSKTFLLEEMVTGGLAEILIGVTRDPAHGFVLTIGAGGVLTELMQDTVHLLVPASVEAIETAVSSLRIAPLLDGYRGAARVNRGAITGAVMAVQAYVIAHADRVEEVEVNPLICGPERAVAADALIRIAPEPPPKTAP